MITPTSQIINPRFIIWSAVRNPQGGLLFVGGLLFLYSFTSAGRVFLFGRSWAIPRGGGGLLFGGDFIIWERVTIWEEVYSAEMGKTAFFS